MNNEADRLLEVLQSVAIMDPAVQCQYFNLRDEMIISPYEGLFAIVSTYNAKDIVKIMERYNKDKEEALAKKNMEKLKSMVDEIGWDKMNELLGKLKGGGVNES